MNGVLHPTAMRILKVITAVKQLLLRIVAKTASYLLETGLDDSNASKG
jgi:hypothetical protein